jgi:hypothetical protein
MSSSFLRNKIINGDMRIDQRYAGTVTANTINGYTIDRWAVQQIGTTGRLTAQRNGGAFGNGGISTQYFSGGAIGTNTFTITGTPAIFTGQSAVGGGISPNTFVGSVSIANGNTTIALVKNDLVTAQNFVSPGANAGTYYFSAAPPSGFTNYLNVTSYTAASLSSTDYYSISQWIEGNNISDLDYGRSTAKPITVSFWAYSLATGVYSWRLYGGTGNPGNYSYVSTFTITTANTWQYFSFVVPGCTLGSWYIDNNPGLLIQFTLACLSNNAVVTNVINTWQSGNYAVANTQTGNIVLNSNIAFNLTGVQIEVGTVATPFERRQYGQELVLCQRYYETFTTGVTLTASGVCYLPFNANFAVTKRTIPTITTQNISSATATIYGIYGIASIGINSSTPTLSTFTAAADF